MERGDDDRLAVPTYHRRLREHLAASEPQLWQWFAESATLTPEQIDQAELQLLKTCYRLDGDVHAALAGLAPVIAGRLGLECDVVLDQELNTEGRNARVVPLGERIHVVFSGDLLDLLTLAEQEAVLAHELAHAALFARDDGAYGVLDHLVHRLDAEAIAADAVGETARRLRLHTEVYADTISAEVTGDERAVVAAMVKVHSGLRTVDPDAYLRQARRIVEADPSASHGWTHPELHVRVACLTARSTADADSIVTALIEGPDDLDRLDLLGQLRLQELTARVLAGATELLAEHASDVQAYVRNYPELDLATAERLADGALGDHSPSVRHMCAALLVDLALAHAGPAAGLDGLSTYAAEATRVGAGDEFDKILARATESTASEIGKLRTP